jgi:hypothetical protein
MGIFDKQSATLGGGKIGAVGIEPQPAPVEPAQVTLDPADLVITLATPLALPQSDVTYPFIAYTLSVNHDMTPQQKVDADGKPIVDANGNPVWFLNQSMSLQGRGYRVLDDATIDWSPVALFDAIAGDAQNSLDPKIAAFIQHAHDDVTALVGA